MRLISASRWAKFPLCVRLAAGAAVVELVLPYRSRESLEHYRQNDALRLVWQTILGKRTTSSPNDICEAIGNLLNEDGESSFVDKGGKKHHYCFGEAWLAAYLLEEIETPNGNGIAGAVDAAGVTLASGILDRMGFGSCSRNKAITTDLLDALALPVYVAAKKVYRIAEELPDTELSKSSFTQVTLDEAVIPSGTIDLLETLPRK